jgi:hypothetical protein
MLGDLPLQSRDLRLQIVNSQHESFPSLRFRLLAPFPTVDQQTQIPGRGVSPPPEPQQLDLQFPFVQRGLSLLPKGFQLLVQSVE